MRTTAPFLASTSRGRPARRSARREVPASPGPLDHRRDDLVREALIEDRSGGAAHRHALEDEVACEARDVRLAHHLEAAVRERRDRAARDVEAELPPGRGAEVRREMERDIPSGVVCSCSSDGRRRTVERADQRPTSLPRQAPKLPWPLARARRPIAVRHWWRSRAAARTARRRNDGRRTLVATRSIRRRTA